MNMMAAVIVHSLSPASRIRPLISIFVKHNLLHLIAYHPSKMAQNHQRQAEKNLSATTGLDASHHIAETAVHPGSVNGSTVERDSQVPPTDSSDDLSLMKSSMSNAGLRDGSPNGLGPETGTSRYFRQPLAVEIWLTGTERVFGSILPRQKLVEEPRHQIDSESPPKKIGIVGDSDAMVDALTEIGSLFAKG